MSDEFDNELRGVYIRRLTDMPGSIETHRDFTVEFLWKNGFHNIICITISTVASPKYAIFSLTITPQLITNGHIKRDDV